MCGSSPSERLRGIGRQAAQFLWSFCWSGPEPSLPSPRSTCRSWDRNSGSSPGVPARPGAGERWPALSGIRRGSRSMVVAHVLALRPATEIPSWATRVEVSSPSACIYVSLYVSQKAIGCRLRESYGKVDDENAWPRGRNVPAL